MRYKGERCFWQIAWVDVNYLRETGKHRGLIILRPMSYMD